MTGRPAPPGLLRFARRRLARGVPYGLGFTVAFVAVAAALWGFLAVVDAVAEGDDLARLDAGAHDLVYAAFGASPALGLAVTWFGNNATLVALVVLTALGLGLARRYWAAFRVAFASGAGGARRARAEGAVPPRAAGGPGDRGPRLQLPQRPRLRVDRVLRDARLPRLAPDGQDVGRASSPRPLGLVVVVAVGLSRVYLNVHFLTDVVAGWLSGAAWLVASLLLVDVVETRYRSRRERREEGTRPDDADPQPHPARTA